MDLYGIVVAPNSMIGLISGILLFLIAKELTGNRKFSALTGAIYVVVPESLVWTSYNFKDPWVQMLTLGFLFAGIKALNSSKISMVGGYSIFALVMAISVWPFRYYVPPIMITSVGFWMLIMAGRSIRINYQKRLIGLVVFSVGVMWLSTHAGFCPAPTDRKM